MGEKFVERRRIVHPRSTILLTRISRRKLEKLQGWVSKGDWIVIAPCHSSGEIFLINGTTRPRDPEPSAADLERVKLTMERYHEEMKAQKP